MLHKYKYNRKSSKHYKSAVIKRLRPRKKRALLLKKFKELLVSKYLVILSVVILSLLMFGYFLFFSNQFLIKNINIEGASEITQKQINKLLETTFNSKRFLILKQNKITNFPSAEFEKKLLFEIPKMKIASVETKSSGSLIIKVEERQQEGIWCAYGSAEILPKCYFYDTEGVIYEEAPNSIRGSLIKIIKDGRISEAQLGSAVVDKILLEYIDNLIEILEVAHERPNYIFIKNNNDVYAGFSAGWEAQFSRDRDLLESVENLILILEEEIGSRINELEYIDLRLGNKAFYKWQGGTE